MSVPGDLFKRLSPGQTYTPEEQQVRQWVYRNREILRKYNAIEAAEMARLVGGMDEFAINSVMSHYEDALVGSHINNRAAQKQFSLEVAIEEAAKVKEKMDSIAQMDIALSWNDYLDFATSGKEFDEAA